MAPARAWHGVGEREWSGAPAGIVRAEGIYVTAREQKGSLVRAAARPALATRAKVARQPVMTGYEAGTGSMATVEPRTSETSPAGLALRDQQRRRQGTEGANRVLMAEHSAEESWQLNNKSGDSQGVNGPQQTGGGADDNQSTCVPAGKQQPQAKLSDIADAGTTVAYSQPRPTPGLRMRARSPRRRLHLTIPHRPHAHWRLGRRRPAP